jgi:hypothetical protein
LQTQHKLTNLESPDSRTIVELLARRMFTQFAGCECILSSVTNSLVLFIFRALVCVAFERHRQTKSWNWSKISSSSSALSAEVDFFVLSVMLRWVFLLVKFFCSFLCFGPLFHFGTVNHFGAFERKRETENIIRCMFAFSANRCEC